MFRLFYSYTSILILLYTDLATTVHTQKWRAKDDTTANPPTRASMILQTSTTVWNLTVRNGALKEVLLDQHPMQIRGMSLQVDLLPMQTRRTIYLRGRSHTPTIGRPHIMALTPDQSLTHNLDQNHTPTPTP